MSLIPLSDGLAGATSEAWSVNKELRTGDTPVSTIHATVATATVASAALPRFSVVGYDASGNLVKAVYNATPASAIVPCGVTCDEVLITAADKKVEIMVSGMFNPAVLVWDASFTTDALKDAAFIGSKAPGIFLKRKPTWGVA